MDGFILTHGIETVDIPEQGKVDKFLPPYNPPYKLDPQEPLSMGLLADPDYYMETRYALNETLLKALEFIPKVSAEFKTVFGRDYGDCLIEEYHTKDAEKVIISMGSVCGTVKDVVDEMRKKGKKVGLLKIICFRPFPYFKIYEALKNVQKIAVLEKAVSLGAYSPLATEIRATFFAKKKQPKIISSFVAGLGGRDITVDSIREIFKKLNAKEAAIEFIDLKPELLKEEYGE
jgi:pyruvate ferredoxin oxidoreductase alpha subunit